jgi:hypothetical protein
MLRVFSVQTDGCRDFQVHLTGALPLLGVQLNAVSLVNLTMVSLPAAVRVWGWALQAVTVGVLLLRHWEQRIFGWS